MSHQRFIFLAIIASLINGRAFIFYFFSTKKRFPAPFDTKRWALRLLGGCRFPQCDPQIPTLGPKTASWNWADLRPQYRALIARELSLDGGAKDFNFLGQRSRRRTRSAVASPRRRTDP